MSFLIISNKAVNETGLNSDETEEIQIETAAIKAITNDECREHSVHHSKSIPVKVYEIYKFSKYFVYPNRHRFKIFIRIMTYVLRFINSLKKQKKKSRKIYQYFN